MISSFVTWIWRSFESASLNFVSGNFVSGKILKIWILIVSMTFQAGNDLLDLVLDLCDHVSHHTRYHAQNDLGDHGNYHPSLYLEIYHESSNHLSRENHLFPNCGLSNCHVHASPLDLRNLGHGSDCKDASFLGHFSIDHHYVIQISNDDCLPMGFWILNHDRPVKEDPLLVGMSQKDHRLFWGVLGCVGGRLAVLVLCLELVETPSLQVSSRDLG